MTTLKHSITVNLIDKLLLIKADIALVDSFVEHQVNY